MNPDGWLIREANSEDVCAAIEQVRDLLPVAPVSRPAVVFDLDGTLFEVGYRSRGILQEWLESSEAQRFDPVLRDRLGDLEICSIGYDVATAFRNAGLDPVSGEFRLAYESANHYWRQRFFDGESLLRYDVPLPGSVAFVERLLAAGVEPVYLTGRNHSRMLSTTTEQLKKHGFPSSEGRLFLKESAREPDPVFKPRLLARIADCWDVVSVFENEYINLQGMVVNRPQRIIPVILSTSHSGKTVLPLPTPVFRLESF